MTTDTPDYPSNVITTKFNWNDGVNQGSLLIFNNTSDPTRCFIQAMLDEGLHAASLVKGEDNTVGVGLRGIDAVFGKIIWLSSSDFHEDSTIVVGSGQPDIKIPLICSVQTQGIATFRFTGATEIGSGVLSAGNGAVKCSFSKTHQQILSIDQESNTCKVLLH